MKKSGQKFFDRDYSYLAIRNRRKAVEICEYLKNIHGIEVPDVFSSQLLTAYQESYASSLNLSLTTIDSIVQACEVFEEYVQNMSELVCLEVITMIKLHTCVISKNSLTNALIPVKEHFPSNYLAIVRKNVSITVTATHL